MSCDIHLTSGDWVDLGLPSGLLWATRNVGANTPTDYGNYYAWGETSPKSVYDWSTYRYIKFDCNEKTKYNFSDGLTCLQPGDDAATANYGGRTPTKEEWLELYNNTTSRWVNINGVNGWGFTGANGNGLFLPAAGRRWHTPLEYLGGQGFYWSSSLHTSQRNFAWDCYFNSDFVNVNSWGYLCRCAGFSVRAVRYSSI